MDLRCNLEMKLTGLGKEERAEHSRRWMRRVGKGEGCCEQLGKAHTETDKQQGHGTSTCV